MNNQIELIKTWLGTGSINLFGYPFAGKDTQGIRLAELLNGTVISSGELLRKSKDNPKLQAALASGVNVPSELFFEIVLPYLKSEDLKDKPLILSEMGRKNIDEAMGTMKVTEDSGHPQKVVILLTLTEEEVWRRFNQSKIDGDRGQRSDDSDEILTNRLEKFKKEVLPVIEMYRQNNSLLEVDGSLSRDEVTNKIIEALLTKANDA
jgi:adenylate kinase